MSRQRGVEKENKFTLGTEICENVKNLYANTNYYYYYRCDYYYYYYHIISLLLLLLLLLLLKCAFRSLKMKTSLYENLSRV